MNYNQGNTTNYLIPAAGSTHYVNYSGVYSAIPINIDWRNFRIDNFPFQPQGVFVDNTAGAGPLTINILPINYNVVVPAGTTAQAQFPAPNGQTMNITGDGQATVIFVDFPVLPNAGQVNIGNKVSVNIDSLTAGLSLPVTPTPNSGGVPYQVEMSPFTPNATTQALTVGTSETHVTSDAGSTSVRLVNDGSNVVFVAFGSAAAIPLAGAPASGFPMIPNTAETFSVPGGTEISVIAAATGNNLYITSGNGT